MDNNVQGMEMDNNIQGMEMDNNVQGMEMDNFILVEVLSPNSASAALAAVPVAASVAGNVAESEGMEVQVQVTANQSNQVCLF